MTLSLTARTALYAQATGESLVALVTLEHPSWSAPIRLAAWPTVVTSRGQDYSPFPIDIILPEVGTAGIQPGRLAAPNVTRELVPALWSVEGPIAATVELVRASAPDIVELQCPVLEITSLVTTVATVEGPLVIRDVATQRYPADQISPATFPGLVP